MRLTRAAKVVILDEADNMLVLRRSNTHPRSPLHLDLPGGIIEDGETFEIGLSREIKEETGLIVTPSSLKLIYSETHRFLGKPISRLVYAVRLKTTSPVIVISWEHADFSWQPIATVKDIETPYQEGIDYANKHNLWSDI